VPPLLSLGAGLSVLPSSLLQALVGLRATRRPALLARLDEEEIGLWRLVARGLESLEIAERTFVSERTAKRMVASLLRKLEVANRVEAALLAGRVGLLDDEDDDEDGKT
jgi:DNA-binding NarL/FixJ family response regulator